MRIRLVASVIACNSVIALMGCGTGTSTAPDPARPSFTQAASPIPSVKSPRDIAVLARRPCELLTSQQASGFELDLPPQQLDGVLGNLNCEWTRTTRGREVLRQVIISTFTNNPTLEVVYRREHGRPFFELTEIAGYPAIVTRSNPNLPHCNIDVKPAERQSFSLTYNSKLFNNNPQQACVVGKQVAAAVLMNLPLKG